MNAKPKYPPDASGGYNNVPCISVYSVTCDVSCMCVCSVIHNVPCIRVWSVTYDVPCICVCAQLYIMYNICLCVLSYI